MLWGVAIVDGEITSLSQGPNALVTIGDLDIDNFEFTCRDRKVRLTIVVTGPTATAIDVVAIGDAIAIEPANVFVLNRWSELGNDGIATFDCVSNKAVSIASASTRLPDSVM